jgi:hypothetical protein
LKEKGVLKKLMERDLSNKNSEISTKTVKGILKNLYKYYSGE